MNRTAIASDRVLFHHGVKPAVIVIEGGVIVEVLDRGAVVDAPVDEVDGLMVIPGLVDTAVHVSEPGRPHWEGFSTATAAAAAGGTTAIFDMPLESIPQSINATALARKRSAARGVIKVDVGFWGGVVPGNLVDLRLMGDAGVFGFFAALTDSGLGAPDAVSPAELEAALQVGRTRGLPVLVDAEAPGLLAAAPEPADDHASYAASRPVEAEVEGVAIVIDAARRTGGWAHIVHLSAGDAIPLLAAARHDGVRITVETCPHFLTLSSEEIPPQDPAFKSSPPIRRAIDRDRLWEGLVDGIIDMIVSDHSPCPPAFKAAGYRHAWAGIAALELRLPLVWTEAQRRGIGLSHVVRWLGEAPGALAQMRTGSIEPGRRADLVAWDPDAEFVVDAGRLHQRNPHTPFEGMPLRGVVHHTWVAGEPVFADRRPIRAAKGSLLDLD